MATARRRPARRPGRPRDAATASTHTAAPARSRRGGRRPGRPAGLTREEILTVASREFAGRGYAAAGVDRIAREAGLNKAMIYYHFTSKAGLYRAILADLFQHVGDHARAIVASDRPADEKLDAMIAGLVADVTARPHLPPIMMRELAEGGHHLDPGMLRMMSVIFQSVAAIVDQGRRAGRFAPVHPLLAYFTILGPVVTFVGSAPVRKAIGQLLAIPGWDVKPGELCAHQQRVLRGLLAPLRTEKHA
jgi:AcrR family transcriptional regulator